MLKGGVKKKDVVAFICPVGDILCFLLFLLREGKAFRTVMVMWLL